MGKRESASPWCWKYHDPYIDMLKFIAASVACLRASTTNNRWRLWRPPPKIARLLFVFFYYAFFFSTVFLLLLWRVHFSFHFSFIFFTFIRFSRFFKTFFLFVDDFCNLFFAVDCCKTSLRLWTSMYLGCRRVSVALVASSTMTWHCFVWSPYGIPGTALRCSISVVSLWHRRISTDAGCAGCRR